MNNTVFFPKNIYHGTLTEAQNTSSKPHSIWCHLCKLTFNGYDKFRIHIMQKHRSYDENTDTDVSDEDHEYSKNAEISECFEDNDELEINTDENEDVSDNHFDEETTEYPVDDNYLDDSATETKACSKGKETDRNSLDIKPKQLKVKNLLEQITGVNQNAINLNSALNSFGNPQFLFNNNPLSIMNPIVNQPLMNNYLMGNQPIVQYSSMLNPVNTTPAQSAQQRAFDFNSRNILKWFLKLKKICRAVKYPLPPRLLKKIKTVKKGIFDNCSFINSLKDDETHAVFEVYEELESMANRHAEYVVKQISEENHC